MPARRVAAGFRRRELAGRREGCTSVRRGRREKALDNHVRFTEAILSRVIYCPSFTSLFCWPTSPSFSQIDQDDVCVLLQAAEDDLFPVWRNIEVVDEGLAAEVGKLMSPPGDEVDRPEVLVPDHLAGELRIETADVVAVVT